MRLPLSTEMVYGQVQECAGSSATQRLLRPAGLTHAPSIVVYDVSQYMFEKFEKLTIPLSLRLPLTTSSNSLVGSRGESESVPVCHTCNIEFSRPSALTRHVQEQHGTSTPIRFVCEEPGCNKEFLRGDSLKRHTNHKHRGATVQCSNCSKNIREDGMEAHQLSKRCMKTSVGTSIIRPKLVSDSSTTSIRNPCDVAVLVQQLDDNSTVRAWMNEFEFVGEDPFSRLEFEFVLNPDVHLNDDSASWPETLDADFLLSGDDSEWDLMIGESDENTIHLPEVDFELEQTEFVPSHSDLALFLGSLDIEMPASWEDSDLHSMQDFFEFLHSTELWQLTSSDS